jgi:hypothetical protein
LKDCPGSERFGARIYRTTRSAAGIKRLCGRLLHSSTAAPVPDLAVGPLPERRPFTRRPTLVGALLLVALLGTAVVLTAQGSIETYDVGRSGSTAAGHPRWTAACFAHPSYGRPLVHFCARVRGRVIFLKREREGDGTEIHFALMSRFRPLIVKIAPSASIPAPRLGSVVTVIGPMIQSRYLLHEVQARSMK